MRGGGRREEDDQEEGGSSGPNKLKEPDAIRRTSGTSISLYFFQQNRKSISPRKLSHSPGTGLKPDSGSLLFSQDGKVVRHGLRTRQEHSLENQQAPICITIIRSYFPYLTEVYGWDKTKYGNLTRLKRACRKIDPNGNPLDKLPKFERNSIGIGHRGTVAGKQTNHNVTKCAICKAHPDVWICLGYVGGTLPNVCLSHPSLGTSFSALGGPSFIVIVASFRLISLWLLVLVNYLLGYFVTKVLCIYLRS